ncbi:cysteine desulfurase family protein [Geobacillus stearothermophilus]|jgi:cysteine desulfurase|uniref:cysteine desulfurase family protein n=1 Tax=Geobacillus stearothermophilus TaxID=1422 RepID=UPI002E245F62|nr:cysteine desulfurase family protein [Geobacillus stearothermophilus]
MSTIYLDYSATTPCNKQVLEAMIKYMYEEFGNPSSQHIYGKKAKHAVQVATNKIATVLGASEEEIIFTSGATESNNLALFGCFDYFEKAPVNVILSPIDHKSTIDVGKELARRGIQVKYVDVKNDGSICLKSLKSLINKDTRIVSVSYVNSEIGTIQPVAEIADICHDHNVLLHIDGVQAFGKIPINVKELKIDLLSISAHKIYGPKGIGALYIRRDIQNRYRPLLFGGGQHHLRSGTLPTPLIVGMGIAAEIAIQEMDLNYDRTLKLRDLFLHTLLEKLPSCKINNCLEKSIPHIINLQFPNISSETLINGLRSVAVSSGSACNSNTLQPSYVLKAIGLSNEQANSSIRVSLSPYLKEEQVVYAAEQIIKKVKDIYSVTEGVFI